MLITLILLFIIVYSPYDMTFNNSRITNFLDIPFTLIFFTDIIVNFLVT